MLRVSQHCTSPTSIVKTDHRRFTAYMSSLVLLHSTTQMVLNGHPPSTWQKELSYAKSCQDVLSHCALVDKVALCFFEVTNKYFTLLAASAVPTPTTPRFPTASFQHLFHTPTPAPAPLAQTSADLLTLLIRPFGAPPDLRAESAPKSGVSSRAGLGQNPFLTLPFNDSAASRAGKVSELGRLLCGGLGRRVLGDASPHEWTAVLDTRSL